MSDNALNVDYWLNEIEEHGPAVVAARHFDKNPSERYFRDEALRIYYRKRDGIQARRIFWLTVITSAFTAILLIGTAIVDWLPLLKG